MGNVVEKVMGWMIKAVAWLRGRLKHITIGGAIIIVLLLCFFGWLTFIFFVGDDLILQMDINQTSFRISNLEDASAGVVISTSNQMFCAAQCNFTVLNVSTNTITVRKNYSIQRGQKISEVVNITPRRVGTGQVIYSVTASCHNIRSLLCPTLSPQRTKTALLTVNYGLATNDAQLKAFLRPHLESLLRLLRQTDEELLRTNFLLAENTGLRPGTLLVNATIVEESFASYNVLLDKAKLLWTQELYSDLYALTANSSEPLNQTLRQTQALNTEIARLPQINNRLVKDVDDARQNVSDLLDQYGYLAADPVVSPLHVALANETDGLTLLVSQQLYQSYPELQLRIINLQNNTAVVRNIFDNRTAAVLLSGNAIIAAQDQSFCVHDAGCNASYAIAYNTTNATGPESLFGFLNSPVGLVSASVDQICSVIDVMNATAVARNGTLLTPTNDFHLTYCFPRNTTINMTPLLPLVLLEPQPSDIDSTIDVTVPDNLPLCCVFGQCQACCTEDSCKDDPRTYPVVFVHGHAFNGGNSPEYSLGGYFGKIQQHMQSDGYLDAGIITPSSLLSEVDEGEWGLSGKPVTARVTYYYNFYKDGTAYTIITQKSENIETYAIRLKELIDIVKHHTGKDKVQVVAHSMGGLVVRRYMQLFGDDSIDSVIFVGTPNQGIDTSTQRLCPLLGETKECSDMNKGSVFMKKVNDPDAQPKHARLVTITATGCKMGDVYGDGVVEAQNARIPGVKNYDIVGNCTDLFNSELHTEILNIEKYPKVYEIIKDELKK